MEGRVLQVIFIALCLTGIVSSLVRDNSFHSVTDCVCPQDVVTFECTVCGLATAWEGTALDSCSGREIALTNRDFTEPIQTIICNGGAISARGISVKDGCFMSQLNITFNATFQDTTVSCSVDNGTHASEVGRDVLTLSTEPYPQPEDVYLAGVSPTRLFFSWNQTQNCPSLRYNILSENCGHCLNTTDSTSVNCSGFTISNSITLCTFMVQAVICSNSGAPLVGDPSNPVTVNLTVPTIRHITAVPHYHIDNGLSSLTVNFSILSTFFIYEEITGSAILYTVKYLDSATGTTCGSHSVSATSCMGGVCSDEFEISSSLCTPSSDINVTVSAVTNLGEGPQTNSIKEEYRNNFVRVQVISQSASINCTFLNALKEAEKSCNAMIIYGETCQDKTRINGMKDGDNVVIINVRSVLEDTIYCSFIVNATANARTVIVEGNLLAISITTPSSNRAVITAVVPTVVVAITLIIFIVNFGALFIILYYKGHREQYTISINNQTSMELPKFKIILVHKESNMIEFARMNIENYDPDSGKGYYQLTEATEEYISSKTQVVLISEDEKHLCVGPEAQKVIGICDKRQIIRPDLSNTKWKYVFIQSNSRVRKLPKGSYFMFYGQMEEPNGKKSPSRKSTPAPIPAAESETLKIVGPEYYTLYPVSKECEIPKFVETIKGLSYKPGLGYGFYQFTKPELISYDKQVILMGKDNKLYYGPDTRQVIDIVCQTYDESKEIDPPSFEDTTWKCAFIQTRSNVRVLQPNTYFLYCTIASPEMIKVTEPHKMFTVPDVDEDERKLIKFATKNIPYYNPRAGYAYYEFTGQKYIIPDRNIMALSKKGELFTGPGVRNLIGAYKGYDETREIPAPDLSGTEWQCIFIQGKRAYGRVLEPKIQFLYCEYDYSPEVY